MKATKIPNHFPRKTKEYQIIQKSIYSLYAFGKWPILAMISEMQLNINEI